MPNHLITPHSMRSTFTLASCVQFWAHSQRSAGMPAHVLDRALLCPHWLEYAAPHWHQSTTSPLSQQEMPGSTDFQGSLLRLWVARWCLHIFESPWESTGWLWWALGWAAMLQQPTNADQQFLQGMLQHRGCVSGETESKWQGIDRWGVTLG